MHRRLAFSTILIALLVAGCNPQPLPVAPTPIPTLIPATLPIEATAAPQATPTTGAEASTGDAGEKVFEESCSVCHNLTAQAKVGPGLAGMFDKDVLPNGSPVDKENLGEWIRKGGGAMPGIPLLDDQLEALIAFLRDATQ